MGKAASDRGTSGGGSLGAGGRRGISIDGPGSGLGISPAISRAVAAISRQPQANGRKKKPGQTAAPNVSDVPNPIQNFVDQFVAPPVVTKKKKPDIIRRGGSLAFSGLTLLGE